MRYRPPLILALLALMAAPGHAADWRYLVRVSDGAAVARQAASSPGRWPTWKVWAERVQAGTHRTAHGPAAELTTCGGVPLWRHDPEAGWSRRPAEDIAADCSVVSQEREERDQVAQRAGQALRAILDTPAAQRTSVDWLSLYLAREQGVRASP